MACVVNMVVKLVVWLVVRRALVSRALVSRALVSRALVCGALVRDALVCVWLVSGRRLHV